MDGLSRTTIKFRTEKKTNSELVDTLREALKNEKWREVAGLLSSPTRKKTPVNLSTIESKTKAGETVIIAGRVLSLGEITKKLRICALGISESAKEKLKASKSEYTSILDEIKKNPKAEGIKIIR